MAISFSTALLNRLVAPGISTFTTCDLPDLAQSHPEATHWLANHFLNAVFRGTFPDKYRQYVLNQLFRAQATFHDYHEARSLTGEFLAKGKPDSPAIQAYYRAIVRWESCLLNLQIFMDVMNRMKTDLGDELVFKKGDDSPEQRAYEMANSIKHWGADVQGDRHAEGDTVPLWLTNTGFETRLHKLTYAELAHIVSEVASVANELQDPRSFVTSADAQQRDAPDRQQPASPPVAGR